MPLPSATQSEQQTILEIQTAVAAGKIQQVSEKANEISVEVVTIDTQSEDSESDNESVDVIDSVIVSDKKVINLDEKIVTSKGDEVSGLLETNFDSGLLETDIDAEVVEILSHEKVESDAIESNNKIEETKIENVTSEKKIENIVESIKATEEIAQTTSVDEDNNKPKETIIEENLLPKQDEKINSQEESTEGDDSKPPVPIQTYMWEDIKRSKEQVSGNNVCNPFVQLFLRTLSHAYRIS